jgi:protein-L-isoaspartate(D-aspartate) O-methyltransferase
VDRGFYTRDQVLHCLECESKVCGHNPYEDRMVPMTRRYLMTAPRIVAITLEALRDQLKDGARILDIGSGSGYMTTCMALMTGASGHVLGIETDRELYALSQKNISEDRPELIQKGQVRLECVTDVTQDFATQGQFDAIHVAVAVTDPGPFMSQLKAGGRLIMRTGPSSDIWAQDLEQMDKPSYVGRVGKKMKLVSFSKIKKEINCNS